MRQVSYWWRRGRREENYAKCTSDCSTALRKISASLGTCSIAQTACRRDSEIASHYITSVLSCWLQAVWEASANCTLLKILSRKVIRAVLSCHSIDGKLREVSHPSNSPVDQATSCALWNFYLILCPHLVYSVFIASLISGGSICFINHLHMNPWLTICLRTQYV